MTRLAPVSNVSKLMQGTAVLRDWAERMIDDLPQQTEDELLDTARNATELEGQAFRLRGACAVEMKQRIREKVRRDPELRKDEEGSIGRQLTLLAPRVGCSPRTLDDDARIYEEFGERFRACTEILPREFYRLALAAPDPQEAIDYAESRRTDPHFNRLEFVEEIRARRGDGQAKPRPETSRLTFELDGRAINSLREIVARRQCSDEEGVTQALIHYARYLKENTND